MPLTAGSRVGAYEIVDLLGAGGMGEVYRAREAKVLATLNHPNIAAVYGLEDSGASPGSCSSSSGAKPLTLA